MKIKFKFNSIGTEQEGEVMDKVLVAERTRNQIESRGSGVVQNTTEICSVAIHKYLVKTENGALVLILPSDVTEFLNS